MELCCYDRGVNRGRINCKKIQYKTNKGFHGKQTVNNANMFDLQVSVSSIVRNQAFANERSRSELAV